MATLSSLIGGSGSGDGFEGVAVSGDTQTLDLSQGNYFIGGELTQDTTLAFSNVPQVAKWSYSAILKRSSTPVTDISNLSSFKNELLVEPFDVTPYDVQFKPDGLSFYIFGYDTDRVGQYTLTTPWDISTATYANKQLNTSSQGTQLRGGSFSPNGTKLITIDSSNDRVYQYTLSTAWDISTANYDNVSYSVQSQDNSPSSIRVKPDGTKMYMMGFNTNSIHQYTLSTPWNISTATYDNKILNVLPQGSSSTGFEFNNDGSKLFYLSNGSGSIHQYTLSTPWDISTATYDNVEKDVSSTGATQTGIFFSSIGNRVYIVNEATDKIFEYDIALLSTLTLPASVEDSERVTAEENRRITYEFSTVDGGTTVQLLNQELGDKDAESASVIKSIQRGATLIDSGNQVVVNFSPVNLEKSSIVITGFSSPNSNADFVYPYVANVTSSSATIRRAHQTTSWDTLFSWEVIEYV